MPGVEFRRAEPQDFSAILKLQSDNYIGNLAVEHFSTKARMTWLKVSGCSR